jgi:hypothetical protein
MQTIHTYKPVVRVFSVETLITLFFITLLLFGKAFTKYNIIGPLYLHDISLLVITMLSLNRGKIRLRFPILLGMLCIAFIYLLISLLFFNLKGQLLLMAFRQFNLFIYATCAYLIFNSLILKSNDALKPIFLIKLIAYLSVYLQVAYLFFGYLFIEGFSIFQPLDYNYFSPLTVFGIITYGALVLAYESNIFWRFSKYLFAVVLSTTLGHSSAFLALVLILVTYLFVRITPKQRLIAVGIAIGFFLLFLLFPQFKDVNAGWRLLYWKHIIAQSMDQKYFLFGHGFGKPYMTHDYAVYIYQILGSPIMLEELYPLATYLSPPHNSILTIVFHIGLIPALLLFFPLKEVFKQLALRRASDDNNKIFLLLCIIGCFVWVCFNVILELPHSSTFFWLVYFTTAFYFKSFKNNQLDIGN